MLVCFLRELCVIGIFVARFFFLFFSFFFFFFLLVCMMGKLGVRVYKLFFMLNSMKFKLLVKTKMSKNKDFVCFVVFCHFPKCVLVHSRVKGEVGAIKLVEALQ